MFPIFGSNDATTSVDESPPTTEAATFKRRLQSTSMPMSVGWNAHKLAEIGLTSLGFRRNRHQSMWRIHMAKSEPSGRGRILALSVGSAASTGEPKFARIRVQ